MHFLSPAFWTVMRRCLASLPSAGSFVAETASSSAVQAAMVSLPPFPPPLSSLAPVSPEPPPGFAELVALGWSEGLASSEPLAAPGSHAVDASSAATAAVLRT